PAQAEVEKDFSALLVLAPVHVQPQPHVRLNCVRALILQSISPNFVDDADASSLLLLIDNCAAPFPLDHFHRRPELPAAIAFERAEHVARHALRVDAHEWWVISAQVALRKHDELFIRSKRSVADYAELSELRRQARLCHTLDCSPTPEPV